ncbi:MAG: hypothetical protein WDN75_06130 [Bacteroidota bacterium]
MKLFFKLLILILAISLQSCIVAKKKYDDMLAQKVKAEGELAEKAEELDKTQRQVKDLDEKLTRLKEDTTSLGSQKRATAQKLEELTKEYDQLTSYYKNLLNNSGKLNRDFAQQKEQLFAIQENLDKTRKANDSLSVSLAEREKKVKELETILSNKDKAVQDLKNKISNALLNFKESDLTVNVKNGKVYVSLAEQLLFGSGSIEVDSKGGDGIAAIGKSDQGPKGHPDNGGRSYR